MFPFYGADGLNGTIAATEGSPDVVGTGTNWQSNNAVPTAGGRRWLLRGFLTNLLNPKVGVFYVTFLPQFVPAGAPATGFMLLLAGIHALLGVFWFTALVTATRPLRRLLRRAAVVRALDRVTGGVLIAMGLRLALESRR